MPGHDSTFTLHHTSLKITHFPSDTGQAAVSYKHSCSLFDRDGIHNLLEIELLATFLISIFNGLPIKVESVDMAKKYPVKIAVVRNTNDTFNSHCEHLLFPATFLFV